MEHRLSLHKCTSGFSAIEVTGAPCSGKSFFIENAFTGVVVLEGSIPKSYGPVRRIVFSFILIGYALVTASISIRQILWLISKVNIYNESIYARLNAVRNSLMNFGQELYRLFGKPILIDEGISHIPFILELKDEDIHEFVHAFSPHLENKVIFFVDEPQDKDILYERLASRGHSRIQSVENISEFVKRNSRVAAVYKKALLDAGLEIVIIA